MSHPLLVCPSSDNNQVEHANYELLENLKNLSFIVRRQECLGIMSCGHDNSTVSGIQYCVTVTPSATMERDKQLPVKVYDSSAYVCICVYSVIYIHLYRFMMIHLVTCTSGAISQNVIQVNASSNAHWRYTYIYVCIYMYVFINVYLLDCYGSMLQGDQFSSIQCNTGHIFQ